MNGFRTDERKNFCVEARLPFVSRQPPRQSRENATFRWEEDAVRRFRRSIRNVDRRWTREESSARYEIPFGIWIETNSAEKYFIALLFLEKYK